MSVRGNRNVVPKGMGDEIETPPWLFKHLDRMFNFDYDVCATEDNKLAPNQGDAHTSIWGERNFMNPPYSHPAPFVRLAREKQAPTGSKIFKPRTTVALLKGDPSTTWWQEWVEPYTLKWWIPFRLRFYYQGLPTVDVANFPSVICIYLPEILKEMNK